MNESIFKSETIWAKSFDSSFNAPEVLKGQLYIIYVGGFMLIYAIHQATSPEFIGWKKLDIFYCMAQTRTYTFDC